MIRNCGRKSAKSGEDLSTVNFEAVHADNPSEICGVLPITVRRTAITVQDARDFWLEQIESYFENRFSGREFTTAFRDFPFTSDWYKKQLFKDWDYEFDTDIWTAIYDAIPTYISQMNGNNFVNIYMNNFYAATADIEFDMNSLTVLHNGGWNEGTVRVNDLDQTAYNSFQYYLIYDQSKLSVQYKYNNSWMTYSTAFGSHGEIVGGLLSGNTEIRVRSIGTISSAQQVSLSACYDAVGSTTFIAKPCGNINLTIRTVAVTRTEVENWVKTTLDDYIESEFYGRELTTQIKDFGLKPEELSEIMRAWDSQYNTDVWTNYYDYVDNPHIASLQYNKFSTLIDRFMDLNR